MTERRWTRSEILQLLELEEDFIIKLEQEAVVVPDPDGAYEKEALERIRISHTLAQELGVNFAGVEVILSLMDRIQEERRQFAETLEWLRRTLSSR